MKKFGEKLRALRKRDGLSLRQLGDMLGIHHSHIGKIELNQKTPNAAMITKIAQLFNVSFDQLMNDELELD